MNGDKPVSSPEFEELLSSLQKIVRQAYLLGRSEALKQVVEVMKTDDASWRPLAITGPTDLPAGSRAGPHGDPGRTNTGRTPVHTDKMDTAEPVARPVSSLPWWKRPARPSRQPAR